MSAIDADGAGGGLLVFLLIAALLVLPGAAAELYDFKRKRAEQARALQARLSDLLVSDPTVAGLAVVPTVRVPFWRGAPVTVELRGHVPTPHLRDAVRELIHREMAAARGGYYLDDRLVVVGSPIRHAA